MCVDGDVASGARQTLVVLVGDVSAGLRVAVAFGQAEVDRVERVGVAPEAQKEVLRLDVAMNEIPGMYVLQSRDLLCNSVSYHLVGDHEGALETQLPAAGIEEVFETGA